MNKKAISFPVLLGKYSQSLKWTGLIILIVFQNFTLAAKPTLLLFIIDGIQSDAIKVAMANGAVNFKFLYDNGVWVDHAYSVSPSPYLRLPDGSLPWGTSSPPNVAMHTGTHVFESRNMDDIFLEGRKVHIKSVFAGGASNYKDFNTADFFYCSNSCTDSFLVQFGIDHFKNDGARLIEIHTQRIRNHWHGPKDKLEPNSDYQKYLLYLDHLLGKMIETLKKAGVWDSTYLIVCGDHGMGDTEHSEHPASVMSSWEPYMNFYGPGIKKGKTIPYAESPDIAIMIDHLLRMPQLKGHFDSNVDVTPKGTTGILLTNIFVGQPDTLKRPHLIQRFLESTKNDRSDDYGQYRASMISYLKEMNSKK
jgi:hypothetical protein